MIGHRVCKLLSNSSGNKRFWQYFQLFCEFMIVSSVKYIRLCIKYIKFVMLINCNNSLDKQTKYIHYLVYIYLFFNNYTSIISGFLVIAVFNQSNQVFSLDTENVKQKSKNYIAIFVHKSLWIKKLPFII